MKQKNVSFCLGLLVAVIVLNYLGSFASRSLGLPVFLDSLGTILGVILGGFWVGAIGGAAYNILSTYLAAGPETAYIWSFSSILIALVVWNLLKFSKLNPKNYGSVFKAGIILSIANSLFTTIIIFAFYDGVQTFPPAITLQKYLAIYLGNGFLSQYLTLLGIELLDKFLVFLIVFGIYKLVSKKLLENN